MATSDIAARLHQAFIDYGYQWKVDGTLSTPTAEDFDQAIDRAKELLYDEPVPSQLEVGRLIIRRHADRKFDVYLYLGDTND